MSWEPVEVVSKLLWYSECKQLALRKIADFMPPADGEEMRMYHLLYVANFFSLLDLATETFGDPLLKDWKSKLDGLGGQRGECNHQYLRELRNAVVHRGENITASGIVIDNRLCIYSPREISDLNKTKILIPFDPLLRNIFAVCELSLNPIILRYGEQILNASEAASPDEIKDRILSFVRDAYHIPEWAKSISREKIAELPLEMLSDFQSNKLRNLLSADLPQHFQITLDDIIRNSQDKTTS